MNQIITLFSDWRLRDPYVAMLKGMLYQAQPEAQIIDITHYIDKFNLIQTALLMKISYKSFPKGSVHLLLTNMSLNSTFSPVVLCHDGHYFIGEDNGVFFLMFGQEAALKGLQLTENKGNTFDQLLHLISLITNGQLSDNTSEYQKFKRMFTENFEHSPEKQTIEGQIVYIDAFNNAITNIPVSLMEKVVGKRRFTATIQSKGIWTITTYTDLYRPLNDEMYLCNNALGLIEIAGYQSDVSVLADLEPGDRIIIEYE